LPTEMRILVNALSARLGGGQTYIRNLLSLDHFEGIEKIYVLKPDTLNISENNQICNIPVEKKVIESPLLRAYWENTAISKMIKELDIDIYFCPGGSLNYVPGTIQGKYIKSVITFQNMLPLDNIQVRKYGFSKMRLRNELLKRIFRKSMKAADLVIFLSEFAMSQAQSLCNGKIMKQVLIPHGIEQKGLIEQKEKPCCCPDSPYLLYVSTLDVYKSQKEVISAFATLKQDKTFHYKLVLAGESYPPYRKDIEEQADLLGVSEEVILTGLVDKEELDKLYANATINIFASQTENCPFILLEAMASGQAVLSSNRPPMPELAGDSVAYFDPEDPDDLVASIRKYLGNPSLMEEYAKKSLIKVSDFNLEEAVQKTWKAIITI
jgi:glycosyltransferase involved in cell wall biosynthesis